MWDYIDGGPPSKVYGATGRPWPVWGIYHNADRRSHALSPEGGGEDDGLLRDTISLRIAKCHYLIFSFYEQYSFPAAMWWHRAALKAAYGVASQAPTSNLHRRARGCLTSALKSKLPFAFSKSGWKVTTALAPSPSPSTYSQPSLLPRAAPLRRRHQRRIHKDSGGCRTQSKDQGYLFEHLLCSLFDLSFCLVKAALPLSLPLRSLLFSAPALLQHFKWHGVFN